MNKNAKERNREICDLLHSHANAGMERLFDSYYKPLVVWADTFLKDIDAASDIVSDFFALIWEKKLYLNFRAETLDTFMRVSVRNRCLHRLEKHDVLRNPIDLNDVEIAFEEYNEQHDKIVSTVMKEIALLPERSREIMTGVFVDGLKYREVAARCGVSESTVKTLLGNAVKRLRERLNHDDFQSFLLLFCKWK